MAEAQVNRNYTKGAKGKREKEQQPHYLNVGDRRWVGGAVSFVIYRWYACFCEATQDQMIQLSWFLIGFEATSDLKINLEKSELILVEKVDYVEVLAYELGCR